MDLKSKPAGVLLVIFVACCLCVSDWGCYGKPAVILATTTSVRDSGLLDELLTAFETSSNYKVKVIAVGSGQAVSMAREGNVDIILTHSPELEEKGVAEGYLIDRRVVMYNYFVLCGPASDPAGVRKAGRIEDAFSAIYQLGASGEKALFVSRGDQSGTHVKELAVWEAAGLKPSGKWYLETGAGMGETLRVAAEKGAYVLCDRGTYLALKDSLSLDVLFEGGDMLKNVYSVTRVNPNKFSRVNVKGAESFADFLISPKVQSIIGKFGMEKFGEPLFIPAAAKTNQAGDR